MNSDRDLKVPEEVTSDANAQEVARAWVANGGLVCALRPTAWEDGQSWGLVLADLARHVANALQETSGIDAAETLDQIQSVFFAELNEPTDDPTGHFVD